MSAVIKNYSCVTILDGGREMPAFGFVNNPMGEATIGGDAISPAMKLSIEPEDYIILWEQSHRKLKFEQVGFRIIGDGSLVVCVRTDLPTSATDYTPLGTRQRWSNHHHNCKLAPWWRCAQTGLSVSTLTNEVADNGGLPRIITTDIASADTVIVDKIVLYNPSEDEVVEIERFHAQ